MSFWRGYPSTMRPVFLRAHVPEAGLSRAMCMLQGLEVSSEGRALARPPRQDLEQWVEEQVAWAASSERTSAQYMEAFAFRRGKALEGAGTTCCCCCCCCCYPFA